VKQKEFNSVTQMINDLAPRVTRHKNLEHSDRAQFRREYFTHLRSHQLLNYAQKTLSKKGEWDAMMDLVESLDAEQGRNWTHWDFFIDALSSGCICGQNMHEAFAAEVL